MINLRSLMDLLPSYFKEHDTYKVNGRGLLERYLNIFGSYLDDQVVKNIYTLNDVIDFDNTPEVCLGYLWEFLGSMPYANPAAIDPHKWKQYFNGFDNDTTIEALSKIWIYRKDSYNDHYNLDIDQIRALIKYSIALFSIRGTKRFFEVLLRLYGFEVTISNGSTYPKTTPYDNTVDPLDSETEITKLDSDWMNLDEDTLDNHSNCIRLVNVNFRLSCDYTYSVPSNEFKRLQDRMFNLINIFLPIGTRPHLIWDGVSTGDNYVPKVGRSIEVYVDRIPKTGPGPSEIAFIESQLYPGWYRVYNRSRRVPSVEFDWLPLKFLIKVVDSYTDQSFMGEVPALISDQPKRFSVAFNGSDFSDTEYDDGHVFTINPGGDGIYQPKFKVSVLCDEDFDLSSGEVSPFIISKWLKDFNYTLFKHYNSSVFPSLSNFRKYIPVLIQSGFIRTYTNNANPADDIFTPQQVINVTTGELLTLCTHGVVIDDKDYSQYEDLCMYVQHIYDPGVYEFAILNKLECRFTIEVTRAKEVLSTELVEGLMDNVITDDSPSCDIRVTGYSELNLVKKISTLPFYMVDDYGGIDLWNYVVNTSPSNNSPASLVGNVFNKPYFKYKSANLYYQRYTTTESIKFDLVFLSKPVHDRSQYLKLVVTEYSGDIDHPLDHDVTTIVFYPVTGELDIVREIYGSDIDGDTYEVKRGTEVNIKGYSIPLSRLFNISETIDEDQGINTDGTISYKVKGVSIRSIRAGLGLLCSNISQVDTNSLYFEFSGLYDDEILIKEITNPVTQYWNSGEIITLDDPGHYRFYAINQYFTNSENFNHVNINVLSTKYNLHYYLELEDDNKSDDEVYMLRTMIPYKPSPGNMVSWSFDFIITVDKSIIEAQDILVVDPNAFDLEVLLYRGSTPNRGILIGSRTANVEILTDDLDNLLPNYKVKGTLQLQWDGTYESQYSPMPGGGGYYFNCPPGLYCVELHDSNRAFEGTPSYRVVDAYVIPQKFDGNLYFDVDVISKAWTSPAGQVYDIEPLTGRYTWGWFKSNSDYLHSVRLVRYDPAVDTPQFRLKLTNNTIGYTRVYLYKLVENGNDWDSNAVYPKVLPPIIRSNNEGIANLHWLDEAIPKDWGFPGGYDEVNDVWDYGKGITGVLGYKGRWLFTGSVYQIGEIVYGPQEPGKYLFLVNQLDIDTNVINYAYLEVKEDIKYSLIVDPLLAILQGTAVGTKIDVISSAKFTKEVLEIRVTNPDGTIVEGYYQLPYAFYAYSPGTYTFELFKFEGGQHISLGLTASFKVLTDNGISDEYLNWEWSDISDREVQVVTTSSDINWTVKVQND